MRNVSYLPVFVLLLISCNNEKPSHAQTQQKTIESIAEPASSILTKEQLISHVQKALDPKFKNWVLFENGTYLVIPDSVKTGRKEWATGIMEVFGPVHAGGPAGDFSVIKLTTTEGWSISGHHPNMYTYVHPSELGKIRDTADAGMEIGLYGRSKRNKDGESPVVIYESYTASPAPVK